MLNRGYNVLPRQDGAMEISEIATASQADHTFWRAYLADGLSSYLFDIKHLLDFSLIPSP